MEEPSPIAKKTQPDDMPMARQPSPPEKERMQGSGFRFEDFGFRA